MTQIHTWKTYPGKAKCIWYVAHWAARETGDCWCSCDFITGGGSLGRQPLQQRPPVLRGSMQLSGCLRGTLSVATGQTMLSSVVTGKVGGVCPRVGLSSCPRPQERRDAIIQGLSKLNNICSYHLRRKLKGACPSYPERVISFPP